jgi:phenylpropionate dioxygenase-like ring-hydroxylating dioxygenase large terminal subunit
VINVQLDNLRGNQIYQQKKKHSLMKCHLLEQEGRIDETGCLQCSYHGWSFNGSGSCTRIPQAAAEGPEARAYQSAKACAIKFPTLVSQGLLFVWPDENGWEKAAATIPPRYAC